MLETMSYTMYHYGTDVVCEYKGTRKITFNLVLHARTVMRLHNCTYSQMEVLQVLHSHSCHHQWLGGSGLYSLQAP